MAIHFMSDLHLEATKGYETFEIEPRAPVLALLGDISNVKLHKAGLTAFLERQLLQFQTVLYVSGNHEPYHSTWPETCAILRELEADINARRAAVASAAAAAPTEEGCNKDEGSSALGELVVLDRVMFRLPAPHSDTVVLGCSLFSHVPAEHAEAVAKGVSDFRYVGDGWNVNGHNNVHMATRCPASTTAAPWDWSGPRVRRRSRVGQNVPCWRWALSSI